MAATHGALRLLPLYTNAAVPPIVLKGDVVWTQALRAAGQNTKQEVAHQATPATWEEIKEAIRLEPVQSIRMALLIAWLTCARGGCTLLLRRQNVQLSAKRLSVQFRAGKSVRSRGQYAVHTALPPAPLLEELRSFLNGIPPGQKFLFQGTKGSDLKEALRRVNSRLEQRSMRRGAIQTLSASGMPDQELLNFSGHTNVPMLRRYLDFGRRSGEGKALAAKAKALIA